MAEVKDKLEDIKISFDKEVNGHSVVLTAKNDEMFVEEAAKVGISKSILKQVADFANDYSREVVKVAIAEAGDDLEAHKTHADVTLKIPFGVNKSDKIEVFVQKEKKYRNIQTGETYLAPNVKVSLTTKYGSLPKSYIKGLKVNLAEQLKGK